MKNSLDKRVTVLTAVYNGSKYLDLAIQSIISQSYIHFEYLIVDDCSTDNSLEIIRSYHDDRIKLIRNESNQGTAKTINNALKHIFTEYVVRLDQDDISLPNRIQEQVSFMDLNKHISFASSWEKSIDSNGIHIRNYQKRINNYGDFLAPILAGLTPIWHPSLIIRTESLKSIGGFNNNLRRAEDFDVTCRLALDHHKGSIINKFHLLVRQHNEQQSIKFNPEMISIANAIHLQSIKTILQREPENLLIAYLRLELITNKNNINKSSFSLLSKEIDNLLKTVRISYTLSELEYRSLCRYICFRCGFGIHIFPYFNNKLFFIFPFLFYLLSPQQISIFRIFYSITRKKINEVSEPLRKFKK